MEARSRGKDCLPRCQPGCSHCSGVLGCRLNGPQELLWVAVRKEEQAPCVLGLSILPSHQPGRRSATELVPGAVSSQWCRQAVRHLPTRTLTFFHLRWGGDLPWSCCSQSPVSHGTVAVECKAGEFAFPALGQRGHAVPLRGQGGDSM